MESVDMRKLFGAEVKRRRNGLGLSQEQLAEQADLHRTYVSDVESGKRNPSLASIDRLARALGASLGSVFAGLEQEARANGRADDPAIDQQVDILLVEDTPVDVDLTLAAFGRAKLANPVQVANDGAQALDFLFCRGQFAKRRPENRPQIVLLDLNLPGVHGLEVLKQIRAHPRTRSIHVVVLTISRRDDHIEEALRLGAAAYIVKPVDFRNLSEVTQKLSFRWALLEGS
jgi:CheY-like chemotaxis protein/DNA-binding XRE family transcriptional regulator